MKKTPTKMTKKQQKTAKKYGKNTAKSSKKSSQKVSGNHVKKRHAPTVLLEESRGRPAGAQNNVIKARQKISPEV